MDGNAQITSRKKEHVDLCLSEDVSFRTKTTGFERYEFEYNALPELNFTDVDCSAIFLGKALSMPLMISGMTGGYKDAKDINRNLAEICEAEHVCLGVGSQRQALHSPVFHSSYSVTRQIAPSIPIVANIGAAEIARQPSFDSIRLLIDLVEANAIAVHLNPLQELLQPEGTPDFQGVLSGIEELVKSANLPVIVKEVGAGISRRVARRLLDVGVAIIDVAGAGGTSWAGVELLRRDNSALEYLWDFGIPTVECLRQVGQLREDYTFRLIASGGIVSGFDIAKSIAFGADLTASARPLLKELMENGPHGLQQKLQDWKLQLRSVMFLTGSATLKDLQSATMNLIQS